MYSRSGLTFTFLQEIRKLDSNVLISLSMYKITNNFLA